MAGKMAGQPLMEQITSLSNTTIKEVVKLHQRKYRDSSEYFLVEGAKALQDIVDTHLDIKYIFTDKELTGIKNQILCSDKVLKKLSSTDSPANIVTMAKKLKTNIEDISLKSTNIALFENIKDPGNLGTIIRSASAFGIDAILLIGDSIDLYNPKVLRSSAGNFFKTTVFKISKDELIKYFDSYSFISTGLSSSTTITMDQLSKVSKKIIMFGSEADGLSNDLLDIAKNNVILNMTKNVESLNLSVAASIIFYEIYKFKIS